MIKTSKRALAVLCALACLFSCMSLAVSAEADLPAARIGYDDAATDTRGLTYDIDTNTLTMRAGRRLRLTCQGDLPENTTVAWSSDDEDVVTIADDGTVTTGKKCEFGFRKVVLPAFSAVPEVAVMPSPSMFILIPCFRGAATIKMTVTDGSGNAVERELKMVIEHSFFDLIRYKLGF